MDQATRKIVEKAYSDIQAANEKLKACGNVLRTILESGDKPSPKRSTDFKQQFRTKGKITKCKG